VHPFNDVQHNMLLAVKRSGTSFGPAVHMKSLNTRHVGPARVCLPSSKRHLISSAVYDRPFFLVWGINAPLPPEAKKIFSHHSSHFTPTPIQKTALFACFRFLIFHSFFHGGQLTPFAPKCGRPWARLTGVPNRPTDMLTTLHLSRHK